jgi:predicted P-loop ATPase
MENAVLEMRRYASFIATSNQKDLLTDPTGSRRFICIEVNRNDRYKKGDRL